MTLRVEGPATLGAVLDALEAQYPVLRGHDPRPRHAPAAAVRALLRLRGGLVARAADTLLPEAVATGAEPFLVVGAMAGG